ncbi:MAG: tRNA threonylcarbamoyladenosine dehydratase [Lentisphaerae bacterium]|nr:tRNA threonylcarbamoyladenosine dehydratase [Lentisphaerota bacterium]
MNTVPQNWQDRTELLLGPDQVGRLKKASVLVVGLGGVGAVAAEMICRAGVGSMTIADGDRIEPTNLNRQLPALVSTLDRYKTEVMAERLKAIDPELDLEFRTEFLEGDAIPALLDSRRFDCVLDAIDSLTPKIQLARACLEKHIPLVACMGAGARLDPEKIRCADISKTFCCPLARAYRTGLAKLGIRKGIQAVFSSEPAIRSAIREDSSSPHKRSTTGTISFMPAVFGCHCAAAVIRTLLREPDQA